MVDKLIMLARAGNDQNWEKYQYVRIPMGYDRANQLLAAIHRTSSLQQSEFPTLREIVLDDAVEFVTDEDALMYDALGRLWDLMVEDHGGFLVRSDFPFSPSIHAELVQARLTVRPSYLYWSVTIDRLECWSADIFPGDLLRALCILAPADKVITHFRQLAETDPHAAAECLKRGGFFFDHPDGGIVRPLPSLSPEDLLPLLSDEDRCVRESAMAALGRIETNMRQRSERCPVYR